MPAERLAEVFRHSICWPVSREACVCCCSVSITVVFSSYGISFIIIHGFCFALDFLVVPWKINLLSVYPQRSFAPQTLNPSHQT